MWKWLRKEPGKGEDTPDPAEPARGAGLPEHVAAGNSVYLWLD